MCWNFNGSVANESTLRPLCEKVDRYFKLPVRSHRHYRYFAVPNGGIDDRFLAEKVGEYYRGLHVPLSGTDDVCLYLINSCLPAGSHRDYDNLVFIRHSTCLDATGCVISYAHEMEHILQEQRFPKLLKVTSVLRRDLWRFKQNPTEIDLPVEVDANIISKRAGELVCGADPVEKFGVEQLRSLRIAGVDAQTKRWEFFVATSSSTDYDWVQETIGLVDLYRGKMNFGIDVDTPSWWHGPLPTIEEGEY